MKLTKLQRHTAYCILLATIEDNFWCCFICGAINESGISSWERGKLFIKQNLPELYNKVPIENMKEYVWYKHPSGETDRSHRIKLLKQCIIETY